MRSTHSVKSQRIKSELGCQQKCGAALPRSLAVMAVVGGLAIVSVFATRHYVLAHAGHDNEEIGEFDLDAPRSISAETAKHMGLKLEEVGTQKIEETLSLSGIVKPLPDRHRAIVSRVSGKVLAISKQVGDAVKKGEVLAVVDSPEMARNLYEVRKLEVELERLLLEVERGKSEIERFGSLVESAKAQASFAEGEFKRTEALSSEGAVSIKETAQRKADLTNAKADFRQKEIELALAQVTWHGLTRQSQALRVSREALLVMNNLDPSTEIGQALSGVLEVKAEADGLVVSRFAMPGHWLQAGQIILEVADYGVVQIEGELPESLIARVVSRKSDKVRIRTPSDPKYGGEGKVRFIAPQLEPIKRTAHLIVDAPNPLGVLRGEMWVEMSLVLSENGEAIVVPQSAVIVHGPMHFVFVEKESGDSVKGTLPVYQKQDINPGASNDLFVEVKDGVYPGDKVVSQGAYSLTQLRPKVAKKAAGEGPSGNSSKAPANASKQ